jgi:hypothetical protein
LDSSAQQLRQLGDVGGDAPDLVAGEQLIDRAAVRLVIMVEIAERLTAGVADVKQASVSSTDQGGGKRRTSAAAECTTGHARGGAGPSTGAVVHAQQLSSSTSRAFVASAAHHFW